ncbi:amino acid adenylation domain-containing protein [Sorangium sp. So ce295]|uniref:amino acid adenylation domain-containing protein n=1 Tax=Sorangium sp. So ce295 TaxID=3133295 RepID=UPI003F629609
MNRTVNTESNPLKAVAERLFSLPESKQRVFVEWLAGQGIEPTRLPIVAMPRPERPPLSFAQRRLWIIDKLNPGTAMYNVPNALRLRGDLDVAALERALGKLIERHEALRTSFAEDEGEPYQVIAGAASIDLVQVDLSGLPEAERSPKARELANEEAQIPFALQRGPLLRAKLLRLSEREHWLLFTMHHIICDEWSNNLLVAEFVEIYDALRGGRAPSLPELPIQYADYAVWQRRWLAGPTLDRQLAYWTSKLGTDDYALALPTDAERPAAPSYRGADHWFEIDRALTERLGALGKRHQATLFMTVLAAFQVLLSRYSGQEDIRVGVPIANRHRAEIEGVVGFFANAQVLRSIVPGRTRFSDLLDQVRQTVADAQSNQDLPFERLVEALQPERRINHAPLFDVMLSWHRDVESRDQVLGGLEVSSERPEENVAKFSLTLHMTETPDGLTGQFIYRTDLFKPQTISRMTEHLRVLLSEIVEGPDRSIAKLRWIRQEERDRTIAAWNAPPVRREPLPVHELFARAAVQRPNAVAVKVERDALSYGELERRANRLSSYLRSRGVGAESRVGLWLPRSTGLLVGLVGVLKSGAAYVPLDPKQPEARLREMVQDSGARVVLGEESARRALSGLDVEVITPAEAERMAPAEGEKSAPVRAEQAAYVIYTSGSTGRPKGVVVTHRGVVSYVEALLSRLSLPEEASLAMVSTIAADLGNTVLFGALCSGRTLHLLSDERVFDPDAMAELMHAEGVDVLKIVPSHLKGLLQSSHPERVLPRHTLILGGEATSWELLEQIRRHGSCRVVNHYGPTETTVGVLTHEHRPEQPLASATLPLGKPLSNSRVYVLGSDLQPMPSGVPGEVYIGGQGVARGYLGRADLTADRFVPDPFGEAGERLYRTGDRAKYLEDGSIEFLGRVDEQVKVRGYRIELGEVRAALLSLAEVSDAQVLVQEGQAGNARLVAYVIGKEGVRDGAALEARLRERLPDYMVPGDYVFLDAFPLTPNGKLDRKALPAPGKEPAQDVPPRTEMEEKLAAVWREVLKRERIGVHDNFFKIGGDSLLSFQVIALARKVDIPLAPHDLFEHQTLAELAGALESGVIGEPAAEGVELRPIAREGRLPMSHGQQRLWFLWQLDRESAAYNIPIAVRLVGGLDTRVLERTFAALVERHETLRTRFEPGDGLGAQVIGEPAPLEIPVVDLSGRAEPEQEARALSEAEAQRPFDLERGPLLRVTLLRLSAEEHVLLVTMHHIVSDGWSMNLVMDEFAQIYGALSEGRKPELPPLPVHYADYAAWQRERLRSGELARQLAYWKEQLGTEHPVLDLPADRPRPLEQSYRGAVIDIELDAALVDRLKALAQDTNATLFMVLLAAFQVLMHRYARQEEIRVGVPNANRNHADLQGLVGFFVNTHVLRARIDGQMRFADVLRQAKEAMLGAQAHQDLPFEQLVEALNPERSLSHNPLFQVMCNHERRETSALRRLEGLSIREFERGESVTQVDLLLNTVEEGERLRASLTYSTDLFDHGTIAGMAERWRTLLRAVTADPEQRVLLLPLLDAEERRRIVVAWNDTRVEMPRERGVHALIERQAARTPDAEAVVFEGERLSYAGLNARANGLARDLRDLGVGPDVLVGVCMERSLELVIALLAILKAGGAYLPLDPEYPAERLAAMLSDARPRVLLAQAHLGDRVASAGVPIVYLDRGAGPVTGPRTEDLPGGAQAQDLAYCIFTSGSTGRPKGVGVPHAGLLNRLLWMQEAYRLTEADRVLQKTPFSFDVSVWEFFWPLMAGATLVVARPGAHKDPAELREIIDRERVTTLHFVPSMLQAFVSSGELPKCASVRQVMCSGEALPAELARQFTRQHGARLHNLYGPTEASIDVTSWECEREADLRAIPIGRPIANTQIHLLDAAMNPVPVGVVGELYIGGVGLARGYVSRPELTAERFVPNPLSEAAGERLYRTGDLARYRADGAVEYIGRIDHQVKLRGFRIELGEIEARLAAHDEVEEAAVVVREDAAQPRRLVAYVVPRRAGAALAGGDELRALQERLRQRLQAELPEYMIPSAIVVLEALPLTSSGKLDRKALPAPDAGAAQDEHVAPRSPLEERLAAIWREVLGQERVGLHDNFFQLGGDSIVALQVVAKARSAGIHVTPKDLFHHQTLGSLAAAAREVAPRSAEQERASGEVPLTPIQSWFFEQRLEAPHHFNQYVLVEVAAGFDLDLLRRSLGHVIAHHDALRLRFRREDGAWTQWYSEEEQPELCSRVDLSGEADLAAAIERVGDEAQRSLDLARGPLLRAVYIDLGASRPGRVLVVIHHLIVDGVSWRVLLEDLQAAYHQLRGGAPVRLPEKTSSFQRWSRALRERAERGGFDGEIEHWRRVIGPAAPRIPVMSQDGDNTVASARTVTVTLSEEATTQLLTQAPQAYRTQVNDLLLTALAHTLCEWSGEDSALVELEGHGREDLFEDVDVTRTVGWFTAIYPVRLAPDRADLGRSIQGIKEQLRQVPNKGVGYGALRALSRSGGGLAGAPEPQIRFNYLGQFDQAFEADGPFRPADEAAGLPVARQNRRDRWIEISGMVVGGRLTFGWTFSASVHDEAQIELRARRHVQWLEELTRHCLRDDSGGVTPSDFPFVELAQDELDSMFDA